MLGVVGNTNAASQMVTRRKPLSRSTSINRRVSGKSIGHGPDSVDSKEAKPLQRQLSRTHSRRQSRSGSQSGPGLFHPIEALQEPLPPADDWILSGKLRKRVVAQDTSWQERLVVLTKEAVFLSRTDTRRVGESIPLLEITSVAKVKAEDPNADVSRRRLLSSISAESTAESWRSKTLFSRTGSGTSYVFEIYTSREGHFNGRTYILRCDSEHDCDAWIHKIDSVRMEAGAREEESKRTSKAQERWLQTQHLCYRIYHWQPLQLLLALLVFLNFVMAIAEAERVPERDSDEWWYFYHGELFFTAAFALELVLNMVGHWLRRFWEDRWNLFDFFIVLCSVVVIPLSDLPGFAILRLFRVFRIMRLFRMMKPLRVLIRALAASVVPVINAFAILCIITCLYAVIGVQLFGQKTPDRFDRFSTAFFTMIQVCTGDGWAEAVARPMWDDYKGPQVSVFFVTYILIAGTFLLNIVVAVLLDEFISSVEKDKRTPIEEARLAHEEEFFKNESPLDPLVSTLTQYTSNEDLDKQIQDIFENLDPNEKGTISFQELQEGLRRLPFEPPIVLTTDDFQEITQHHRLCHASGQVDAAAFTVIMRTQLRRFVQKYLNLKCMDGSQGDNTWLILSLKQMLLTSHPDSQQHPPGTRRLDREERLERLVASLHDDMLQIKHALLLPSSHEYTPGPSTQHTPAPSKGASFKSSLAAPFQIAGHDDAAPRPPVRRSSIVSTRRSSATSQLSNGSAFEVASNMTPDLAASDRGEDAPDDPPLPAALVKLPSPEVIGRDGVTIMGAGRGGAVQRGVMGGDVSVSVARLGASLAGRHHHHDGLDGNEATAAPAHEDCGRAVLALQDQARWHAAHVDGTRTEGATAKSAEGRLPGGGAQHDVGGGTTPGLEAPRKREEFKSWMGSAAHHGDLAAAGGVLSEVGRNAGSWRGQMLDDAWEDARRPASLWAETHSRAGASEAEDQAAASVSAQLVVPAVGYA